MNNSNHIAVIMSRLTLDIIYQMREYKMSGLAIGCSDETGIRNDIYQYSSMDRLEWIELIPTRYYPGIKPAEIICLEKELRYNDDNIVFDVYK